MADPPIPLAPPPALTPLPFLPDARRLASDLMMGVVFGDSDALPAGERARMVDLLDVFFGGFAAVSPLPFFGLTAGERAAAARGELLALMGGVLRRRRLAVGAFFDGNMGVPCLLDALLSNATDRPAAVIADTLLHVLATGVLLLSSSLSLLVRELAARPAVCDRIVAEAAASRPATTAAAVDAVVATAAEAAAAASASPTPLSLPEAAALGAAHGESANQADVAAAASPLPTPPPRSTLSPPSPSPSPSPSRTVPSGGSRGGGFPPPPPPPWGATPPTGGGRVDVLSLVGGGLPYLDGVVREVLRLNPTPAWRFRAIRSGFRAGAHTLPAGWAVVLDHAAIHRDATAFPDPHAFRPERYATGAGCPSGTRHYVAFGSGRRQCPAPGLAVATLKLFALRLVRDHDFVVLDGAPCWGWGGGRRAAAAAAGRVVPSAPFSWTIVRKGGGGAPPTAAATEGAGGRASLDPPSADAAASAAATAAAVAAAGGGGLSVPLAAAVGAAAAAAATALPAGRGADEQQRAGCEPPRTVPQRG